MKKSTLLIALILLSACDRALDKKTREAIENAAENSNVIISPLEINLNDETESELVDFGQYRSNTVKVKRVQISNKTISPIQVNDLKSLIEAWDDSSSKPNSVSVTTDSCSGKLLTAGDSCFLDVSVAFNEELASGAEIIPIRGTEIEASPTLQLMLSLDTAYLTPSQSIVKSTSSLNFGYMTPGSVVNRRVYVSNTNEVQPQAAPIIASSLPAGMSVTRNTCGAVLSPKSSCFIDFTYENQPQNLSGEILLSSSGLSAQDSSITLSSVSIQETLPENAPKVSLTYRDFSSNSTIGSIYVRRFIFSNNSSLENFVFSASEISSEFIHPSFNILTNTCDGKAVRPGKFCIVDVQHSPTINGQYIVIPMEIPSANFNQEVRVGNQLQSCPSAAYIIVNDACVIANQSRSCTAQPGNSNGGTENSTDGGQSWGICSGFSCSINYEVAGSLCAPQACQPADIANSSSVSGDKVLGCTLVACNSNYTAIANSCVSSNQSRACTVQPDGSEGGSEYSTDGAQTWGSCSGFSCISSLKEPQGVACVDKTPTGEISFAATHTNQSSEVLSITQEHAQQIEIYSDAACSSLVDVQSIAPSIIVAISAGEGIKTIYAQLVNGLAKSACKSASIIKEEAVLGDTNTKISWNNIPLGAVSLSEANPEHKFYLENTSFYQQGLLANDFNLGSLGMFPSGFSYNNPCGVLAGGALCEIDLYFDADMFHYQVEFTKEVWINGQEKTISLTGNSPCNPNHPNAYPDAGLGKRLNEDKNECIMNLGVFDDPNSVFGHAVFQ